MADNDIPAACFVRSVDTLSKERKPVFVDFTNWFHLPAAERMLDGELDFVEPLPDPRRSERVIEYLIEFLEEQP